MRIARVILAALLLSLLLGLAIGSLLQRRAARPVVYIGLALPTRPLDVAESGAVVLDTRHHEEQIG
jgi:hypothetical protein